MNRCWLCNQPVEDPPEIIGQWTATTTRLAHRRCLVILGELDLDLKRADTTGPGPHPREVPGR